MMLWETLEIFRENLMKYGERYILDNYVPKDGTYILITMANPCWIVGEPLQISFDKKKDQIEGREDPQYPYVCLLDYYSKLIDMNKPMDSKEIIHSNNYYTFFVKKDAVLDSKFSDEIINGYYAALRDPRQKYEKSPKTRELYQRLEEELGQVDVAVLDRIHQWISGNLGQLIQDISGKDYLKLFFVFPDREKTEKAYMREGKRYIIPNIYNSNDYNQVVDGNIMGLPNDNMGMNSKKPYLANLSRKVQVPYLLGQADVLLQAKFFDFLMGCVSKGRVNIYFDCADRKIVALKSGEHPQNAFSGYFLRIKKGKEVEIQNADTVVHYNPNLTPVFYYKKILKTEEDAYEVINKRKDLEILVSDVLFDRQLVSNYFTGLEDLKIQDGVVLNQMVAIRERLFSWFYKNDGADIAVPLQKTGKTLIRHSVCVGHWKNARKQINLLWSLEDYLAGNQEKEESMNQVVEQLKSHMNDQGDWEYGSDEEYYFAVGQLVSYFIGKSNAQKKPLSFINPFLNAGNDSIIKKHLGFLFKKYNYDIEYKETRVKRLYSHAMLYKPKAGGVDTIMISAGVTANNLIFMKSEKVDTDLAEERQVEQ